MQDSTNHPPEPWTDTPEGAAMIEAATTLLASLPAHDVYAHTYSVFAPLFRTDAGSPEDWQEWGLTLGRARLLAVVTLLESVPEDDPLTGWCHALARKITARLERLQTAAGAGR